jgi:phosphopantothenoylcysteine decarboxylase / phosphopantothenate---cysteine ligase
VLKGKNVILAVSGSISAYKAAYIIRLLIQSEASVRVIMTDASEHFITPLTLSTLAKSPVYKDFTKDDNTGEWNNHVELGLWADVFLLAPATANTLAKMSSGQADSFLLATYLSAKCPVFVAPAMDLDMYKHGSTQDNIQKLISRGNHIIYPENGELASGLSGEGRLAEPDNIIKYLSDFFASKLSLTGKKILITAGPTFEPIDPVRFIGNHSSGKMGIALVNAAIERGADVTLIHGPISLTIPKGVHKTISVNTANEMFTACEKEFLEKDIIIMAAAVADYTPVLVSQEKIKKKDSTWSVQLEKTIDILQWMGEHKHKNQLLIGFALETHNQEQHAKDKLVRKQLDAIVLNTLKDNHSGFKTDTNQIMILDKYNKTTNFELKDKSIVAEDILDYIENLKP